MTAIVAVTWPPAPPALPISRPLGTLSPPWAPLAETRTEQTPSGTSNSEVPGLPKSVWSASASGIPPAKTAPTAIAAPAMTTFAPVRRLRSMSLFPLVAAPSKCEN